MGRQPATSCRAELVGDNLWRHHAGESVSPPFCSRALPHRLDLLSHCLHVGDIPATAGQLAYGGSVWLFAPVCRKRIPCSVEHSEEARRRTGGIAGKVEGSSSETLQRGAGEVGR